MSTGLIFKPLQIYREKRLLYVTIITYGVF